MKLDVLGQGWKNFGRRRTRGVGALKIGQFSWTSYVHRPLLAFSFVSQGSVFRFMLVSLVFLFVVYFVLHLFTQWQDKLSHC